MGNERLSKTGTVLYSVIETAKANGLNFVKYAEHFLTEIPARNLNDEHGDLIRLSPLR